MELSVASTSETGGEIDAGAVDAVLELSLFSSDFLLLREFDPDRFFLVDICVVCGLLSDSVSFASDSITPFDSIAALLDGGVDEEADETFW
jgi:hypothetical protein